MKVAIYQGPEFAQDVQSNLDTLAIQANQAAAQGARLLIAPEMFLTGYNIGADSIANLAEPAAGASALRIAEIATDSEIAVLYGYPQREDDTIFNAAQLIERDGSRLANYRKTHLFGDIDRGAFAPGDTETTIVELDDWRIGILICYDVEFPENVRRLALAGADFVAVPTATMKPYEFVPRIMLPTRAFENGLFVAYANHCGFEGELEYCGLSCLVGPDGVDLARADKHEALVFAELERSLLDKWRQLITYLPDRRPGLYRSLGDDEIDISTRTGQ
ncbi:MAG: carbon-nitrogen hydrolase family protein [Gammaproteobacteria bacterium]|nr:carbon-nitrogen hydrolase family protein [Gammaproteobacteria bacterium]MDH3465143.1 carbon-nitrogen hydrolase family protein [Gammaproteobacteria bacterium]